jgi:hypothetical protein
MTAMTMRPYVIRQGDYWTKIAATMGFDAEAVWNHARNEQLRSLRPNRDVLAPGDVVYVPAAPGEGLQIDSGGTHRYKARVAKVTVDITLREGDQALANEPFSVEGLARADTPDGLTTDENGRLRFQVPIEVREVRLIFAGKGYVLPVRVGDLDPIEELTGVRQRLEHLGFYAPFDDGAGDPRERDRVALRAFQGKHGLGATGELDDATRAKIAEVHGS